jgi:hypothetical protein
MALLAFNAVMLSLAIALVTRVMLDAFGKRPMPPFIRTRQAVAVEAAEAFGPIPPGSVVYDLGAGDGRMLRTIAAQNPGSSYIGIELRRFPFLLGRLKGLFLRPRISLVRGSLFAQDLGDATHIYTYLYPWVMEELLPKLEREVRPGTTLISLDFPFPNREAQVVIPLRAARTHRLGKSLNVYTF